MKIRVFVTGKWCAYTCRNAFWEERNIFLCHLKRKGMKSILYGCVTGLLGVFKDFCHTEIHIGYVAPVLWITQNWSPAPSFFFFFFCPFLIFITNIRGQQFGLIFLIKTTSVPLLQFSASNSLLYLPFYRLSHDNFHLVKTRKIRIYLLLSRFKDFSFFFCLR